MNIKSVLKSASLEELREIQALLPKEIGSRTKSASGNELITFTDGASRGNPGLAGAGVLLFNQNEDKIMEDFQFLGVCTNNEAEYRALLLALDHAKKKTRGAVQCYLDSELTVRQLNGQYAIKSEKLLKFYEEVKKKVQWFESVTFHHVPREHPKLQMADRLANKAIDQANEKKERSHGG